jgi:peptidoglycan hydrolase-like protein with peptidoglycan-binding domain
VAFQTAAGLEPDGVVGRLTWAALLRDDAPSMPGRDVSADTLRKEGSRTVAAADRIAEAASGTAGAATVAGVAGAVGTVGTAISGAVDVAADAGEQLSGLDATALVVVGVIMLVVVVAAVVVFANARRQKIEADRVIQARVDDARSGANLGR